MGLRGSVLLDFMRQCSLNGFAAKVPIDARGENIDQGLKIESWPADIAGNPTAAILGPRRAGRQLAPYDSPGEKRAGLRLVFAACRAFWLPGFYLRFSSMYKVSSITRSSSSLLFSSGKFASTNSFANSRAMYLSFRCGVREA